MHFVLDNRDDIGLIVRIFPEIRAPGALGVPLPPKSGIVFFSEFRQKFENF